MNGHVGDDAELYALGMLDPERRLEIDAHLASCDDCLRAVGEAEETAAALASALPGATPSARLADRLRAAGAATPIATPLRRRGVAGGARWLAGMAVAAAFLLALGTTWYQNSTLQTKLQASDVAVAMLVHSHFSHVPMTTTPAGGSLSAKVIYARDGSWMYVVIDGAGGDLEVVATIEGKRWAAGRAIENGRTATLFTHPPARPQTVELMRDGTPVASAKLIY